MLGPLDGIPVSIKDNIETAAPMLPCRASTQRFANWFPWMLMGQPPGTVFARTSGGRIGSIDELPPSFLHYAKKHFPDYLAAPKQWTGQFVDVLSVLLTVSSADA